MSAACHLKLFKYKIVVAIVYTHGVYKYMHGVYFRHFDAVFKLMLENHLKNIF